MACGDLAEPKTDLKSVEILADTFPEGTRERFTMGIHLDLASAAELECHRQFPSAGAGAHTRDSRTARARFLPPGKEGDEGLDGNRLRRRRRNGADIEGDDVVRNRLPILQVDFLAGQVHR